MKYIKEPKNKRKTSYYYGKCINEKCAAIVSAREEETYFQNEVDLYRYCYCPNCKSLIPLKSKKKYII